MGSKSNYLENTLLDYVYGNAAFSANIEFRLYTVTPTDAGGGTEVAAMDYARVSVVNDATSFPAAAGGIKYNGIEIDFGIPTTAWGTVVAWSSHDDMGNMLHWGPVTPNVNVAVGTQVVFDPYVMGTSVGFTITEG